MAGPKQTKTLTASDLLDDLASHAYWIRVLAQQNQKQAEYPLLEGSVGWAQLDATLQGTIDSADAVDFSEITGTIDPSQIASGTISGVHIENGAITATKIASGTITATQIAASTITGTQISAGTLTSTHIQAGSINSDRLYAGAVEAQKIQTQNLAASSVTTNILAASSITSSKIQAGQITATLMAADSVTTTALAAGSVTAAKIAAGTITATEIAAGTITATQIASATITGALIAAGTVTATNIAAGTITSTLLAADAVTSTAIASGAVTATKISVSNLAAISADMGSITAGTITGATIRTAASGSRFVIQSTGFTAYGTDGTTVKAAFDTATGNLTLAGVVTASAGSSIPATTIDASGGGIVSAQIENGTIVGADIAANTIAANNILAATITATELASDSVTSAKILANTITAGNIASGTITATQIAAGTITASQISSATITATQIAAGTITADRLSVTSLSAITADLGTVTAGTITGATIKTAASGDRLELSSGTLKAIVGAQNQVVLDTGGLTITTGGSGYNQLRWLTPTGSLRASLSVLATTPGGGGTGSDISIHGEQSGNTLGRTGRLYISGAQGATNQAYLQSYHSSGNDWVMLEARGGSAAYIRTTYNTPQLQLIRTDGSGFGVRLGYLYGDTAAFGLLNGAGQWMIRGTGSQAATNTGLEIYAGAAVIVSITDGGNMTMQHTSINQRRFILGDGSGSFGGSFRAGTSNAIDCVTTNAANWADLRANSHPVMSDRSLKDNIRDLGDGLSLLRQLRPVKYAQARDGVERVGFIAQEVLPILPEVVDGEDGSMSLHYHALVAPVVVGMQELDRRQDSVAREVEKFGAMLRGLADDVAEAIGGAKGKKIARLIREREHFYSSLA